MKSFICFIFIVSLILMYQFIATMPVDDKEAVAIAQQPLAISMLSSRIFLVRYQGSNLKSLSKR